MSQTQVQRFYNQHVNTYANTKKKEWRIDVERYSLITNILGNDVSLRGKRILDLGCGDGVYSREALRLNAELVVGIDISEEMIKLAKQNLAEEKSHTNPKIQFFSADCSNLEQMQAILKPLGCLAHSFDIIIASWLIGYSKTKDQLDGFVSVFEHYLEPENGRLVGIHMNPLFGSFDDPSLFLKYGFVQRLKVPARTGDHIYVDFVDSDSDSDDDDDDNNNGDETNQPGVTMTIASYFISKEDLVDSFSRHNMYLDLEPIECNPRMKRQQVKYYETLLVEQPFVIITATKETISNLGG
eukprot:CAMPEP_0184693438 /NCGR_PEP_ID=MMETSP0313-20130426/1666_1 /TAXON_ID=2792 /ORGANISM="Porphyridium aerugineum, Strain SAG 1380-2" /LENGTH=297 /DNA_ID=CAMNT_0027151521 /DNA_START=136 /DNA_END=1029 /DNA_ORIENTATION=+